MYGVRTSAKYVYFLARGAKNGHRPSNPVSFRDILEVIPAVPSSHIKSSSLDGLGGNWEHIAKCPCLQSSLLPEIRRFFSAPLIGLARANRALSNVAQSLAF